MATCICGHTWEEHFHQKADRRYCTKCSCGHFEPNHARDCPCARCTLTRLKPIDDPIISEALRNLEG